MGKTVFKAVLLIAWLGSVSWLLRYEAFPHWFDGTVQGYRELANDLPAMRDTWMKIYSRGEHVGYLNSSIEIEDVNGNEELIMGTQLMLRILFQGRMEPLRFSNRIRLNARHELLGSESGFFLSGFSGDFTLSPREGAGNYQLAIEMGDLKITRPVSLPAEAIVSSPLLDQGVRDVKPGQVVRIRALDPFSMSGDLQTIEIHGISTETRILPGESQTLSVTTVETRFGELVLVSEVDQFGRVLSQKTPFGLNLLMSDPQQAMKIPEEHAVDPMQILSSPLFQPFLPEASLP